MQRSLLVSLLAVCAALAGVSAPAAAQATIRDIRVCVIADNELREIRAEYNSATGDTTLNGRPFSETHQVTTPPYAAGAAWYINNGGFNSAGDRYQKYGLPRVLGTTEVVRVGFMGGVPVFAEPGGSLGSEVLYVPVRPGCEFQPYQSQGPIPTTPAPAPAGTPVRIVERAEMRIGSAPGDVVSIEEIRFTSRSTEVLLRFYSAGEPYAGVLHPPGADLAMFLRDTAGNEYPLTDQEGWLGSQQGGFGGYSVPADTERLVILYFEPVSDPGVLSRLSLVEGDCADGCWHFTDIRLQDR